MYETWLIPYLEGTLDAERRTQLEARLTDDPALASALSALRRAEPRLRAVAGRLRRAEAARPADASLWPALHGRLDTRPTRFALGPALGWAGGLCAAGLLTLAVLNGPILHPQTQDKTQTQERKNAPVIVSHPDNAVGSLVAARLRAGARRVAAERQAANTPGQPPAATRAGAAPPPFAMATAAMPPAALRPAALPRPTSPPVQVAKREPDAPLHSLLDLPSAPTHSPAPPPAAAQADMPAASAPPPTDSSEVASGAKATRPLPTLEPPVAANNPVPAKREALSDNLLVRRGASAMDAAPDPDGDALRALRRQAAEAENAGDWAMAAAAWRRVVLGSDADGEDWFRLAEAETRLGHADAARRAYGQALRPGREPLSPADRATALQYAVPAVRPQP